MATPAQVAARTQPPTRERHYTATVTAAAGRQVTVALDPGGTRTTATALSATVYAVGARVLVLATSSGNYVLGSIG